MLIDVDAILYEKDETWRHAKENVVVKCYPLSSLMNTSGQTHIDYFSLDVEGVEMIILQSINWKHLDIDVFTIETDQHRQDILTFMKCCSSSTNAIVNWNYLFFFRWL
jgi:hypothetical protein